MLNIDLWPTITSILQRKAQELKRQIDDYTPEDTQELIGNTKISEVSQEDTTYSVSVYNDTEYAKYVEYGRRDGRKFMYRKPKWTVFYVGNGARMFGRAKHKLYGKIRDDLFQAVLSLLRKQ